MKENLRTQEAFIADVDVKWLLRDAVHAIVCADPLRGLCIVFGELLGDVGADVRESLFDCFGSFEALFWGDAHLAFT